MNGSETTADIWTSWIGWALGYDNVSRIESWRVSFGADWAHNGPAWLIFGCLALSVLSVLFYLKFQKQGRRRRRVFLGISRAVLMCLLLFVLADPILEIRLVDHPKPILWVLFDGTQSMAIEDKLPTERQTKLADATDWTGYQKRQETNGSTLGETPTRMDYLHALVQKSEDNFFEALSERYRLRGYVLDRADGVRAIEMADADGQFDAEQVAEQLTADGEVTALGAGFEDLALRHASGQVAGLLVFSDFNRNAGPIPEPAAKKLKTPVYTVGLGAKSAIDLAIDHIESPVKLKKAEQSNISVAIRQQELPGETVHVRLSARAIGGDSTASTVPIVIGEKDVQFATGKLSVDFPFTPKDTGRYVLTAEVGQIGDRTDPQGLTAIEPLGEEIVSQNNATTREITVIDDFMRLLYVAYEPTWEWRFVKEVFHRDELVGMRGFRTFLRSSDPIVRESNELFLPSLTLPRNEFFSHDVIFLGDMPADALSTRFCEMTKEFVSEFGGGLVVIAGSRFGPGQLAKTPLADMLPVFVDPDARPRSDRPFRIQRTPIASAAQFDFMQLGETAEETEQAWNNLGRLNWYQPVQAVEPSATTVLAEHPTDMCLNGQTKQPLIAVRQYGRGEVVYIAFNELWRLRRLYGEKYYRNFWGPLIKRLGLSHALGQQKRFVVRTDRKEYQADDKVLLSIEAYDEDFQPLGEDEVETLTLQRSLDYELLPPNHGIDLDNVQQGRVSELRPGVFEARIPVFQPGEYTLKVRDPVTSEWADPVNFQVASLSVELRNPTRNVSMQTGLATATNGKSYELDTLPNFLNDTEAPALTERTTDIRPLWATWPCFAVLLLLCLSEWWMRKLASLP